MNGGDGDPPPTAAAAASKPTPSATSSAAAQLTTPSRPSSILTTSHQPPAHPSSDPHDPDPNEPMQAEDRMFEHMHLHVSPTRGEVHAHGRWHKYVKPRIGPGFQVKELPDGPPDGNDDEDDDGNEEKEDEEMEEVSESAAARAETQPQQPPSGKGFPGARRLSRDSSAGSLAAEAVVTTGTRKSSRRTSGRSTPVDGGRKPSSRPSSRQSNSDAVQQAFAKAEAAVSSASASASANNRTATESKDAAAADEQEYYTMPTTPYPTEFKLIQHKIRPLEPREGLILPPPMGGLVVHRPHYYAGEGGNSNNNSNNTSATSADATTSTSTSTPLAAGSNKNASFLSFCRNLTLETPRWNSGPASLEQTDALYQGRVQSKYGGLAGTKEAARKSYGGGGSYYRRSTSGVSYTSTGGTTASGKPRKKPGRKSKAELAAIAAAALSKAEATSAARKRAQERRKAEAAASRGGSYRGGEGGGDGGGGGSSKGTGKCFIPGCSKFKQSGCNGMCRAHFKESQENPNLAEEAERKLQEAENDGSSSDESSSSEEEDGDAKMGETATAAPPAPAPARSRSTSPRPSGGGQKCAMEGCDKFKQSGCNGMCRAHYKESLAAGRDEKSEKKARKKQRKEEKKRAKAKAKADAFKRARSEEHEHSEVEAAKAEVKLAQVDAEINELDIEASTAAAAIEAALNASVEDSAAANTLPVTNPLPTVKEEEPLAMDVDSRSVSPMPPTSGREGVTLTSEPKVEGEEKPASMEGPMPYLENDERMLTYLHGRHSGDQDAAMLSLLSHLSMGRAVQARRKMRKVRKREEVEGVPLSDMLYPSEIWRRRYERLFNHLEGDMRKRRRTGLYSYDLHDGSNNASSPVKRTSSIGVDMDGTTFRGEGGSRRYDLEEELKKPWRCVLDCAEALVQRLPIPTTEGTTVIDAPPAIEGQKPSLEELLILLRKAHTLPRPEEVFGKRDTAVKRISMCMNTIIDLVAKGRDRLSSLNDTIFDEDGDGVDLVELEGALGTLEEASPLILREISTVRQMLGKSKQWEKTLNRVLEGDISGMFSIDEYETNKAEVCVLTAAQRLVREGKGLSLRPRSLVQVKKRVDKALILRDRLREMDAEKGDTMKQYSALVREANKIDLAFPEVNALSTVHQAAEEWTDRATIAMRSRLSLAELEELVETGSQMPVNLSDLLGKLRSRVEEAHDWIAQLKSAVPGSEALAKSSSEEFGSDRLKWLQCIRNVFNDEDGDGSKELLNLASDGSRIPVDIMELQLLQIETDARNWTIKARKWTENKGKIDDLRDHLSRGDSIRDRVRLGKNRKGLWGMDVEDDLKAIVKSADKWLKKHRVYIEGDRRRSSTRCVVSLPLLRSIVGELNDIPANLGNPATKMKRILGQAESWYDEHKEILAQCGIEVEGEGEGQDATADVPMAPVEDAATNGEASPTKSATPTKIQYDKLKDAVDSATEVSLDMEEALALKKLLDDSQDWYDRAMGVAPKRNKRTAKGKKKSDTPEKPTLNELLMLVKQAPDQLIDTTTALQRLNMQLNDIQSWRLGAQCSLKEIAAAMTDLRNERKAHLGAPEDLLKNTAIMTLKDEETVKEGDGDGNDTTATISVDHNNEKEGDLARQPMDVDTAPTGEGDAQAAITASPTASGKLGAFKMIASFLKEAQGQAIYSVEEEIAEMLEKASEWLQQAAGYIAHPAKLFVKRNFKDLDRFIEDGIYLLRIAESPGLSQEDQMDDLSLLTNINTTWAALVNDEKIRLEKLRDRRDQFKEWDEKVKEMLEEDDKRLSLDTLKALLKQGAIYPQGADAVKKLQEIVSKFDAWAQETATLIASPDAITIEIAKEAIDKGDELNISCQEYRTLRNALRQARGWILRVKKMNNDETQAPINEIKDLIAEHSTFLVKAPEQVDQLKEMLCGYCLCRKPYDGFMVGCDNCDEWYHGPCVGVTEQQAEKFDRYMCIRCCTLKQYEMCADKCLNAVKKWTNPKDLNKSRTLEGQRHQRKIREKKREQEKLRSSVEDLTKELKTLGWDVDASRSISLVAESPASGAAMNDPDVAAAAADAAFAAAASMSQGSVQEEKKDGGSGISTAPANAPNDGMTQAIRNLREKLKKTKESIEASEKRLEYLNKQGTEIKTREALEDSLKDCLRRWCILLRMNVLIPATDDEAKSSRPLESGQISRPMALLIQEATKLGISNVRDVKEAISAMKGMSWSLRALSILAAKPNINDVKQCVDLYESGNFRLPEEKCVRMIKSILGRAKLWQEKASRALRPIPGEMAPYDKAHLERILLETKNIPYSMPEEARLTSTIEDKGARHCLCGGPSDGSFMISCDKCEKWFHAECVKFDNSSSGASENWICPPCTKNLATVSAPAFISAVLNSNSAVQIGGSSTAAAAAAAAAATTRSTNTNAKEAPGSEDSKEEWNAEGERSPHAPDPNTLWPPFGLLSSEKAMKALGVSKVDDIPSLKAEEIQGTAKPTAKSAVKSPVKPASSIPPVAAQARAAPVAVIAKATATTTANVAAAAAAPSLSAPTPAMAPSMVSVPLVGHGSAVSVPIPTQLAPTTVSAVPAAPTPAPAPAQKTVTMPQVPPPQVQPLAPSVPAVAPTVVAASTSEPTSGASRPGTAGQLTEEMKTVPPATGPGGILGSELASMTAPKAADNATDADVEMSEPPRNAVFVVTAESKVEAMDVEPVVGSSTAAQPSNGLPPTSSASISSDSNPPLPAAAAAASVPGNVVAPAPSQPVMNGSSVSNAAQSQAPAAPTTNNGSNE